MRIDTLRQYFIKNNYENSFILFSLLAHIQAAITCNGFHHFDEHFQILEPLGWKMGFYPPDDLAWEFPEKMRPGLQVFMGYCLAKVMVFFNVYSPFMLTAILRQLSGMLAWGLTWVWYKKWKAQLETETQKKTLLVLTALLWFLPYLHVRYSSENWGMMFFFGGLYIFLYPLKFLPRKNIKTVLAGIVIGLSFYFRYQMAFAIIGLLAWLLVYDKYNLRQFLFLFIGGVVAACVGTLTDCWLYDELVITPYRYFFQNITLDKASGFGVSPFWYYIPRFIETAAPPVSIILLLLIIPGLYAGRKNLYTWIFAVFFVAHSMVAHKEMRFLFPMVILLPLFCAQGYNAVIQKILQALNNNVKQAVYKKLLITNIVLLLVATLKPANETEGLYKAFYIIHKRQSNATIAFERDPFGEKDELVMNFFKYCNSCFKRVESGKLQLVSAGGEPKYFFSSKKEEYEAAKAKGATLEYSMVPILPEYLNIGNWQNRSRKGFIWKMK